MMTSAYKYFLFELGVSIRSSRVQLNDDTETCFVSITGMTCASCVDSIQRNLSKVEGNRKILNQF